MHLRLNKYNKIYKYMTVITYSPHKVILENTSNLNIICNNNTLEKVVF